MSDVLGSERVVAGALLVLIAILIPVLAVIGGLVSLPMDIWGMPLEQKLRTIAAHPSGWRSVNGWFLASLVLSSLGLASVTRQLQGSQLAHIADLALVAYVIGAILWIAELAMRMSAMMTAADQTVGTGSVPVWAEPLATWGGALFIVYATLSNVALLAFGMVLLRADLLPAWAGWVTVGMSILVLALLVIMRDNIPAMNLVAPVVIGVALLLPRS